jgi:ABC-type lipoprotein export system ATPase subunit
MRIPKTISAGTWADIKEEYSYVDRFFATNGLPPALADQRLQDYFDSLNPLLLQELGTHREELTQSFYLFIERMEDLRRGVSLDVASITILGGQDKQGRPEVAKICVRKGSIVSIVGATGSGKSQLLADIDWMAQADTPTQRRILINGCIPEEKWRFSMEYKLVAQLSQNMNYVMDLSVANFIRIHAECRLVEDVENNVQIILDAANDLSGESFAGDAPLTSLSGGQSRALMVAETAHLSRSPIVLIDEIENAGIHRQKALDLLVGNEKIVLIVTHDPLLALMGERRIVIQNGGISKVIETSEEERNEMGKILEMDNILQQYREKLRAGQSLGKNVACAQRIHESTQTNCSAEKEGM